eukprot:UN15187
MLYSNGRELDGDVSFPAKCQREISNLVFIYILI